MNERQLKALENLMCAVVKDMGYRIEEGHYTPAYLLEARNEVRIAFDLPTKSRGDRAGDHKG